MALLLQSIDMKYFNKNSNSAFLEYRFFWIKYKQIPEKYKVFADDVIRKDKETRDSIINRYNEMQNTLDKNKENQKKSNLKIWKN